jgi:hypothetical protein
MAITSGQVAVGSTPTLIHDAADDYQRLQLKNAGAASVFLGGSGVTITTGYELAPGASISMHNIQDSDDDLYARAAVSGTVHYLAY